MNTKLTLTIERSVIEKAKQYSREHGQSLSGIVENYLKFVTGEHKIAASDSAPITKSLRGAFKSPDNLDYKKELSDSLSKKYLQDG